MYNILLVDDEKVIVDGMTVLLGQLNPEKLFTMKAYSGDEALKLSDNKRSISCLQILVCRKLTALDFMKECWKNGRTAE